LVLLEAPELALRVADFLEVLVRLVVFRDFVFLTGILIHPLSVLCGTKFASGPMAPMYEPRPSVINSFRWLGKIDMTTSGSPADRTRHERTFPAAVESRAGRGRSGPETSGSPGPWD